MNMLRTGTMDTYSECGVRRLEDSVPSCSRPSPGTTPTEAVWRCVELYRQMRPGDIVRHTAAEDAGTRYLAEVTGVAPGHDRVAG